MTIGLGDTPPSPELIAKLSEILAENEKYLSESLIPDIRGKMESVFTDSDVVLALQAGLGTEVLRSVLGIFQGRVAQYASAWWATYNYTVGELGDMTNKRVEWQLDITVQKHCVSCLEFGDTTYESMSTLLLKSGGIWPGHGTVCRGNCRCTLRLVD